MKDQHREMFFFTEKYNGKDSDHHEIVQPWKNTLNYINKFSISEEDGFDIGGVFTMTNSNVSTKSSSKNPGHLNKIMEETYKERTKILNNLSKAAGCLHVFISGMKLYRNPRKSNRDSYVELNQIIRDCLFKVDKNKVASLRVTVMEFRVKRRIRPSIGVKISSMDVGDLYKKQHQSLMSFNNDLDLFYEQCLHKKVPNEVVQFFHAQQLTAEEFQSFQCRCEESIHKRFSTSHRQNCSKYTKVLGKFASIENDEIFNSDWNIDFVNAKNIFEENKSQLNDTKRSVLNLSENQDYKLFIGYRASFQVPLDGKSINKITKSSRGKLTYLKLWNWADVESEQEYKRQLKSFRQVKPFNNCLV